MIASRGLVVADIIHVGRHNLMLRTVTAGGFFSIGGMTGVDEHGGTIDAPS